MKEVRRLQIWTEGARWLQAVTKKNDTLGRRLGRSCWAELLQVETEEARLGPEEESSAAPG